MKLLVIRSDGKNNKAYFVNPLEAARIGEANALKNIEDISKEDLLSIVDYILENDFELDLYQEGIIPNQVQDVIYKSLWQKLSLLKDEKDKIISEVDSLFKDAENKYNS